MRDLFSSQISFSLSLSLLSSATTSRGGLNLEGRGCRLTSSIAVCSKSLTDSRPSHVGGHVVTRVGVVAEEPPCKVACVPLIFCPLLSPYPARPDNHDFVTVCNVTYLPRYLPISLSTPEHQTHR